MLDTFAVDDVPRSTYGSFTAWKVKAFACGQRGTMSEILLTFSDVARKADVTRRTLYKWQRTGRFNVPPHPNTQPLRWHVDDIDNWLKPQTVEPIGGG